MRHWRRWMPVLTVFVAVIAVALVWRVLHQISLADTVQALRRLQPGRLLTAGLLTAGSYLALSGFDWLGLRYAGRPLPYHRVLLASFVSLSLGNTLGLAPMSSGAIRYRFYAQWGLSLPEVGLVVLFSAVTVTVGEISLATVTLLWRPDLAARLLHVPTAEARWLGIGGLVLLAAYLAFAALRRRSIRIGPRSAPAPAIGLALGQIAVGTVNYALEAGTLHETLASVLPVGYATAAAAFLLANLAAVISHVPGGLGVIEAAVITLLPEKPAIAGVVAFRAIYFFIPFAIGLVLFGLAEAWRGLRRREQAVQPR